MRRRLEAVRGILASALFLVIALVATTPAWADDALPSVRRIAGEDRYQTMAAIASEGFDTSEWAIVASGENYPDALAANALAGAKKCPVILTNASLLNGSALRQLQRLGVKHVLVMGGTSAVRTEVSEAIKAQGIDVARIEGADRVATSLAAYRQLREMGSKSNTVVVASSRGYADALSIGPWAYRTASPVVLAKGDGLLSDETVAAIKADKLVTNVLVVGGMSAVAEGVKDQLGAYAYTRLSGSDRYETSAAIVEWEVANGLEWTSPAIATGQSFADALAGAPLEGVKGSVLLLCSKASNPTVRLLATNFSKVRQLYVLGGERAVPSSLASSEFYDGVRTGKVSTEASAVPATPEILPVVDLTKYPVAQPTEPVSEPTTGNNGGTPTGSVDAGDGLIIDNVNYSYVANKNTMRFHKPTCGDVKRIADHNRANVVNTRESLISLGYSPCGHCHP